MCEIPYDSLCPLPLPFLALLVYTRKQTRELIKKTKKNIEANMRFSRE